MPYGTIKVDNVIYTKGGVDTTITVSGIVDSLSGAISVTGSISGASVSATTGTFTTLSGNTTAGTTATFVTGVFTTSLSGATITGNTGQFSNITGVSGVFTTRISGATITGNTGQFGSITGISGVFTSVSGTTFTVTSGVFASGTAAAPSVSVGTTTNGLYSSATNEVALATNSSSRLVVDASGNVNIDSGTFYVDAVNNRVGVGTTGPTRALDIAGSIQLPANNALYINGASNYLYADATATELTSATQIKFVANGALRATLDASGNLGLGVVPSAWNSVQRVFEISYAGNSLYSGSGANNFELTSNAYFSTSWKYGQNGAANRFNLGSSDGSFRWYTAPSGTAGNAITFTQAMTLDASGRLLVGTSDGSGGVSKLVIQGASNGSAVGVAQISYNGLASAGLAADTDIGYLRFTDQGSNSGVFAQITATADATTGASDYPGRLVFSTTADGASSPTPRMQIGNTGRTQIFSSDSNTSASVNSSQAAGTSVNAFEIRYSATSPTDGTASLVIRTNGNVLNTNNSYGAISDIKLKENIVDATSQWSDIKSLQVRKYNFKEGQTHTQIGLIAQEVELVSPGLVSESPDRDAEGNDLGTVTKSVNYSVLYMKAVKALQEAMERIEKLEAAVAALKA